MAKILVVEDESIVALNLQNRLKALGYTVCGVASSGEEAIKKANESRPDLVLMDIMLRGEMDGVNAAESIRQTLHVPVVFLTAYADDTTLARAKVTEPSGYILKPFELKEIRTTIEIALYKHQMEELLRKSEERYALAANGANDGIWDWDLLQNRVYYSPRWKALVGHAESEIEDTPAEWMNRIHPEDSEGFQMSLVRHLDGITTCLEYEFRIKQKDGSYRWVFCRGLALRKDNRAHRVAGSLADVSKRREAEDKLLSLALLDPLTDLATEAAFLGKVHEAIQKIDRFGGSLGLIRISVPMYADLYDSHGPENANRFLVDIAGVIAKNIRRGDFAGRLHSGELAVLLLETESEIEIETNADRIRIALSDKKGQVGWARLGQGESLDQLLGRAANNKS